MRVNTSYQTLMEFIRSDDEGRIKVAMRLLTESRRKTDNPQSRPYPYWRTITSEAHRFWSEGGNRREILDKFKDKNIRKKRNGEPYADQRPGILLRLLWWEKPIDLVSNSRPNWDLSRENLRIACSPDFMFEQHGHKLAVRCLFKKTSDEVANVLADIFAYAAEQEGFVGSLVLFDMQTMSFTRIAPLTIERRRRISLAIGQLHVHLTELESEVISMFRVHEAPKRRARPQDLG